MSVMTEAGGTIEIVIVDDEKFVRGALRTYLSQTKDLAVVGEGENGEDAIRLAQECRPDVLLIDLQMPVMDGVTAIRHIVAQNPEIGILVVTGHISDVHLRAALLAGAGDTWSRMPSLNES
ncbi:response regulator transcription factor [Arthrobacter alpinus]|nr:response regulator transcription factor [Arthrobacter alpinus]